MILVDISGFFSISKYFFFEIFWWYFYFKGKFRPLCGEEEWARKTLWPQVLLYFSSSSFLTSFLLDFDKNFQINFPPMFHKMCWSDQDWTLCPAAKGPGWRTMLRKIRFNNDDDFVQKDCGSICLQNYFVTHFTLIIIHFNNLFTVSFGDAWLQTGGDLTL